MKDKLAAFLGAALAIQQLRPTPLPSEARNPPAFQPRPCPGKPSVQRRPMSAPAIPSKLHRRKPIAHTQKQPCSHRHRPDVFNMRSERPRNPVPASSAKAHRRNVQKQSCSRRHRPDVFNMRSERPAQSYRGFIAKKPVVHTQKQSCHRPDVFNMRSERLRNPVPTPSAKAQRPCAE